MPLKELPLTNAALRQLRIRARWTQKELGIAIGDESQIREIENGRRVLKHEELEQYARVMEVEDAAIPVALGFAIPPGLGGADESEEDPMVLPSSVRLEIERATLEGGEEIRRRFRAEAFEIRFAAERQEAERLWQLLAPLSADLRKLAVGHGAIYRRWGLAVLLCERSVRAAAHQPKIALNLSKLALAVSRRVRGSALFRRRLEAFALAHKGNALRVGSDLNGADRLFARVAKLWVPVLGEESGPLDASRLFDLEASLRRAQRQFGKALELLERAMEMAPDGHATGRILLKRAFTFEQAGDNEAAIAALREALPRVDAGCEVRDRCVARFNLAVNLLALNRLEEAERLVPEVRRLVFSEPNDLDLLRLNWLEGRLSAAHGHRAEAIAAIDRVVHRFWELNVPYDSALAVLDLAALLLESGRARDAAQRVSEVAPVFRAQRVLREELASLWLFLEAIEQQAATAALARAAAGAWRRYGCGPSREEVV